jgi:hypothetical protein
MALLIEMFPNILQAIGLITVRWSSIDGVLYDILRNFLPSSEQAEEFRGKPAGRRRLDKLLELLEETSLSPEDKDALKGAVDRLLQLWGDERNYITHGQYGTIVTDDGLVPSWSDIKKETHDLLEPAQVTADHLVGHADAVSAAAKPLRDCLNRPIRCGSSVKKFR